MFGVFYIMQNKEFIYRGKDYEKVGDFTVRIQNNFPAAQVCVAFNEWKWSLSDRSNSRKQQQHEQGR